VKKRLLLLAGIIAFTTGLSQLWGCSEESEAEVITATVKNTTLRIEVPAKGEVVAAHSTVMSVPSNAQGPQTIAWLMAENSTVKKGDVIARFDGETYLNKRQSTQLDLDSAGLQTQNKSRVIASEKADIKSDTVVVDKEIGFSDRFNIDDLTVYSKNEIIDALDNREYLSAQKSFLGWKMDNFSFSSANEMELMELKAQQYQTKLDQFDTALTQLEVLAPHDGLLIYEKNWRGEKPRIGQTLWPGRKMAKLPQLDELNARLFVLESEAGSINVGDRVAVRLDAKPDRLFDGKVQKKGNISKTIKSGDPVKYFEVTVSIENPDLSLVKPGNKVTATISGASQSDILSVPLQAVFNDGSGSFVYVKSNGKLQKKPVTLGLKTFAEVHIKTGLTVGEQVALFKPVTL
jgi:multidrug efflux pump subunit AcrA (membrane-fusion protein)